MIPEFPNFKKIEVSDKAEIEKAASQFLPYSDFNFVSMWSWNTQGKIELSLLNGNLVVKFTDYLNNEPFYSFLGNANPSGTSDQLLKLANVQGVKPRLKLIPEESLAGIDTTIFKVEEDRDHFDYILDNEKLAGFNGPKLNDHASFKRRLEEVCGADLVTFALDVNDPSNQKNVVSLNELWISNKVNENKDVFPEIEFAAIKNFFNLEKSSHNFVLNCVFFKDRMIAFTVDELLNTGYSVRHFMKADSSFKGIYSYLISVSAEALLKKGRRYTNIEQDLGLLNLRRSKKSYQPDHFLKKYTVEYIKNE